ncbi:biotin--[acetyl-CoA-carboxylase] ligase [Oleiagrimonas soli]|uniref:Bifunctional ligase/repressor BirA n=1 Tax=Oleiagrimonas soli TaxID=1543381 RepID=A0A099CYZ2_9GAMM|nr:biotin--[acetyl-CoA-carboxylase] ligase [Oleiagrimonas soli]KGI78881.1 biotin--acetyl-CoA-carboxylase ligase [Oleiagrimonas soli]MBB6184312.1 BirA family biotin operon repressor/biotin-[acetyl-CoA-carboxylase] ligase [Oleiagrimonas soli]
MQPRDLLAALAAGAPLSGAELARQLGLTRAAVWKQVEQLREQGLPIKARRGAGYRLPWPVQLLDARLIRKHCAIEPGALEVHWSLDSTSSECQRRASGLADGSVILAETQHAGRGRRGRHWLSPPGLNMYLSCLKRFDRGFAALSGLSLAVGVALVRALEAHGYAGIGLKWPNDVLVRDSGAKLAGILVELSGEYQGPSAAVIGIGLNLRLPEVLRAQAGQAVADLAELGSEPPPDRNLLIGSVIDHLLKALKTFDAHGFEAFLDDYAARDLLRSRVLRLSDARGQFEAIGDGVDARGALRVLRAGEPVLVDSADVTVRAS